MKWFKIETDILTHPKINSLPPSDLKMWLFLLALAAKNDGRLPDAEGIAKALSRRLDHVLKALLSLSKSGLIESYEGGYVPHNWEKHQAGSYSSAKRMRKFRAKCDVTVTPENRIEENIKENIKEKGLKKVVEPKEPKEPKRTRIAEDAQPSERDRGLAAMASMTDATIDLEWQRFRAHHAAKGSLMASWGQAWVTWVTNWKAFGARQAQAASVTALPSRGRGEYRPGIGMVYPDGTVYSMLHNRGRTNTDADARN